MPAFAHAEWAPLSQLGLKQSLTLELNNLEGKTINLQQYKGKVVFVNFWASWCEPCKEEFGELVYLQEKYQSEGLVVLAVNLAESRPRIKTFLQANLLSENALPIVLDNSSLTYRAWKVRGIPTTYLVDREGVVKPIGWGLSMRRGPAL
jgi:thiol-disulfide isomerase/thioredoxin